MTKVSVQRLGLGDTTPDGPFYPKVDGNPVGEDGRAFWPTREEALAVAERFVAKATEYNTRH